LDKFLKVSRIIKRRTIANSACDAGRILVNGKAVRASYEVKIGDVLETTFGSKPFRARVTDIKEHITKNGADMLYEII